MKLFTVPLVVFAGLWIAAIGTSKTTVPSFRPKIQDEKMADRQERLFKIGRWWSDKYFDEKTGTVLMPSSKRHLVRESVNYAYGLLLTKNPSDFARAEKIISAVLDKQDLRAGQSNFGAFPWSFEDQWETLPPDRRDPNYTSFVGTTLGLIIDWDREEGIKLDPQLRKRLDQGFRYAVEATLRRDVQADYTNIVLLSAAVAAQGDSLFAIPGASDFAKKKLKAVLERISTDSTFEEYLSPTYYGINLESLYTALKYASPSIKPLILEILDVVWLDIAKAYHAPTFQLAGPHSRSYGDNMFEYAALLKYFIYLAAEPSYPLFDTEEENGWDLAHLIVIANLPIEMRREFKDTPDAWRDIRVGTASSKQKRRIRQYRQGNFILGSVSSEYVWTQQRNVVAYWALNNGNPNSIAYFVDHSGATEHYRMPQFASVQQGGAILASLSERGHPSPGGQRLVFSDGAKAVPFKDGNLNAWQVERGDVIAHVYPISENDGRMTLRNSEGKVLLERSWDEADDSEEGARTLVYLIVFQLPNERKPEISNVSLQTKDSGWFAVANVNGVKLELPIQIK